MTKAVLLTFLVLLAGCSSVPVQLPAPKPTAFILVGDCSGIAFAVGVDNHGNVGIIGGNSPSTDADKKLVKEAHDQIPDTQKIQLRVGDCSDL